MAVPIAPFLLAALLVLTPLAFGEDTHCGQSKYADVGAGRAQTPYIVGGKYAREYEFPWTVSIRWKGFNHIYAHTCTGALLSESWVITAGHCLRGTPIHEYVVVLGQTNFYLTAEENPWRQEFELEDWFWYDDVAKENYYEGDIGLMKIKGRVELNQNVRTICYAHPTYDYVGEEGVVAGWGKQTPGSENTPEGSDQSPDLKFFKAKILSNEACREVYTSGVTDNMLCAGELDEHEHAPCGGDNGTPLVVYRGMWELVGLYGWSYGCAEGKPTVYVRINKYHDWIDMIMKNYPNIPNYP